jgi:hypothetical protein
MYMIWQGIYFHLAVKILYATIVEGGVCLRVNTVA